MNIELIEKYCKNTCTGEELRSVLEWFEKSARTPEGKALLLKIWEELPDDDNNIKMNFDLILDKIHHKVNLDQSKKLLEEADQNLIKFKRRKHFIYVLTRVAAIIMLPVFSFGLYMSFKYHSVRHGQVSLNQTYNEIYSSVDAITKVSLPDGSIVWLNHSSTLKYPAMFLGESRTVELTGEGYFEVAHNPQMPFVVKAEDIQVKSLGTEFNVLAYPNDDKIEISLISGKVVLLQAEQEEKGIPLLKMEPKDWAIFQKTNNEISTQKIIDDRHFSWKEGKLIFNKEPIDEVVKKLSRWFNVDIQIKDPELYDLTYTATFVNETLPQVLELLSMVTPINYSISNREELNGGTFTKRKVVLSYRGK